VDLFDARVTELWTGPDTTMLTTPKNAAKIL